MITIYKYPLKVIGYQELTLPPLTKILCVKNQREDICLWAEVDTDLDASIITPIFIVGTGHPVPEAALEYIGTVQMESSIGELVWHVYRGERS